MKARALDALPATRGGRDLKGHEGEVSTVVLDDGGVRVVCDRKVLVWELEWP